MAENGKALPRPALSSRESIQLLPLANPQYYTQILGLVAGRDRRVSPMRRLWVAARKNVRSDGAKTPPITSNSMEFDAITRPRTRRPNDGEEVGTGIPAPDAIQEFMVQTANYDASYGEAQGQRRPVRQERSNQFHGKRVGVCAQ